MPSLKERLGLKEITAGTIRNYLKSIKLFCQSISWDKITRGLQWVYGNAEDRAPTNSKIRSSPGLLDWLSKLSAAVAPKYNFAYLDM